MKNIKRKVGFFFLSLKRNGDETAIDDGLKFLVNYIISLSKTKRKFDVTNDRFCFIESSNFDDNNNIMRILFKSANHSYRAPLINRRTIEERDNPKTVDEGERHNTHLVIKFVDGDAIVFLETYQGALKLKQVTDYLNHFISLYNESHKRNQLNYFFDFDMIPRDNFREVLDSMRRVVCANVYIEKQLLGSDALNFSERVNEVQEEIIVEVKAKRNKDISTTVNDLFAKFSGGQTIKKIRVTGKNQSNNEIVIDTDFIGKREYVDAQLNEETGEINSVFMFSQLTALALEL